MLPPLLRRQKRVCQSALPINFMRRSPVWHDMHSPFGRVLCRPAIVVVAAELLSCAFRHCAIRTRACGAAAHTSRWRLIVAVMVQFKKGVNELFGVSTS